MRRTDAETTNSSALTGFNATTLSNTVTAFRDILPGQEITISCSFPSLPPPLSNPIESPLPCLPA